ncbi:hypothetical protein [Streptomyces sp. NPDC002851]
MRTSRGVRTSRTESADMPVTPGSPGGWDSRSEEVLASGSAAARTAGAARRAPRRGAVDPVKALMHRHQELCARAVDPLEIAAGLEAHGITDRTAARFRHRDVFSLAEEMYARVPRGAEQSTVRAPQVPDAPAASAVPPTPPMPAGWAVVALLPGALCAAAFAVVPLTPGRMRLAVLAAGVLAVCAALRVSLRYGPLGPVSAVAAPSLRVDAAGQAGLPTQARGAGGVRFSGGTRAWSCLLLAYAVAGDGLARGGMLGTSPGDWPLRTSVVLALTLAVAPGAWCARLFSVRVGRRLAVSRGLRDFAAGARPLLLGVLALFLAAVLGLLLVAGRVLRQPLGPVELAAAGALGVLLLLVRLLAVYGESAGVGLVLGTACAVEAVAVGVGVAGRLPEALLPYVPLVACGGAALVLAVRAARRLTLAATHAGALWEER